MIRQLQNIRQLKALLLGVGFLVFFLGVTNPTWAQTKEYTDSQTNGKNSATILLGAISGGYSSTNNSSIANVEDPDDAVDTDEGTYATMKARNVSILVGSFSGEAWLQMNYANTIEANKTTYIKLDEPEAVGLGLDLLNTVGGLLGLLDENILITEVYNGTNSVSSVHTTMARDGEGDIYLAVTPSEDYNGVRIKLRSQSNLLGLSLGGGLDMKVYDAFYYTDGEDCGRPAMTYFEDSGVNIALLDFQDRNIENAIDNDESSYSTIKQTALLNANVAGTQSQVFEYTSLSSEESTLNIKLSLGSGGAINTDLLGSAEVVFYNGEDIVYERSLQSSLLNNTDALDLLNSGSPVTMTFAPGRQFDRVEVRLTSPIGLSVAGSALQIYDVQRYDDDAGCVNPEIVAVPNPTDDPFDIASCSTDLIDFDNVDFAQRAVDGNNESYATLYADAGDLLVGDPVAGFIEMDLGSVPANKTTYVRIGYDEDVLDALLGGSLGKLVGDLANNLLLGNQYIQVEAKNGATTVLNEDSSDAFEGTADGVVTLVEDNIGRYYLAITPASDYDRIRITNHVTAVLPTGKQASLDVYNACFETGEDSCFPANFTSYKGGGANLSVGDLSEVGVKDPYKAISGNSSEYSEINLGVVGVAANVYQTVYFNQPSQDDDHVQIRLMVEPPSSALSLDVLGTYKVRFFNGNEQVGPDYDLQDGLINNIDLLALFNSGGTVTLDFEPEDTFDRVDIGAETTVGLNVSAEPLRVYDVKRYGDDCPLTITESPFEDNASCIAELIDSQNADEVQNLFDDDFDSYATLKSGAGFLLGLGNQYEGFVEMGYAQMMEAGTTSYIRIDFDDGVLDALVSGSLGNIVGGLLDGLALGDHYFKVDVKNDENLVFSGSSKKDGSEATDQIRIVQDALGRYYIAVTPDQDYNRIRVTDVTNSALGLLAEPNTMNVYGMCTELSTDTCLPAFATSYEYSGLNLGVDAVGSAGVTNPEYALDDGNSQHYSEISNGTLGVGASTKQWIYFNTVSDADDAVLIKFETDDGAVDLDLLGGLEIKAYLGNDEVAAVDWGSNGIVNGVNVLDLLTSNQLVELPFKPGAAFDRISVGIKTLVQASVFPPTHLYSVERCYDLQEPEYVGWKSYVIDGDATLAEVKGGEEVVYTIHIENTGDIDIEDLLIEDELPEYTTYVSGGNEDNGVITFDPIDVAVGVTETVSFTVQVDDNLTGVDKISNIALVKTDDNDPGQETYPPLDNENPDEPDDSGDPGTDIPVHKIYEVESWKAYEVDDDASVTSVSGGETITYAIYVRNTSSQDLTDLTVSDDLPDGVTYVSGGTLNGNTVEFTLASLPQGETSNALSFIVEVEEDLTDIEEIKNIAVTSSPDLTDTESHPPVDNENPEDPDLSKDPGTIVDIDPIHSVEFSKTGVSDNTGSSGQAAAGDVITYTLTVKNTGNKTLENLSVSDPVPGNTAVEDAGDFTENSGTMEATIATLEVDEEIQLTFQVRVEANLDITVIDKIENTAEVTFSNEDNSGNYIETADFNMPADCNALVAADIDLSTTVTEVCEGEEVILTASSFQTGLSNVVYKWYKNADLSDAPFVGAELITNLTETATFYVTIEADGYCFDTPPAEIEIGVEPLPTVPSITTHDDLEFCEGDGVTLQADGNADSYIWYLDGQEIQGETDNTLWTEENGIYTVAAVNNTGCVSEESASVTVTVNDLPDKPIIDLQGTVEICEGETIELTASAADHYEWYLDGALLEDENGDPIDVQTINASEAGDYTVRVFDDNTSCGSEVSDVTEVVVNPAPEITIDGNQFITVAVDAAIPWPDVTSDAGSISWLDETGNVINESDLPASFNAGGMHTYTVVADNGTCESARTITINVYDAESCPQPMERVYATKSSWGSIITGGVTNQDNAVDGNVKTYSTITTGVGLLGIGTTWQTLKFDETVAAGTPATIKLGKEYSGLMLAGGLSVVGVKKNSLGDYVDIGVIQPVSGGLLDLLVADNVVEYTFVPSTITGPKDYDGIRISQGALVSVAQNAKVYGAYYEAPGQPDCSAIDVDTNPDVQDVLHGVKDLGIGAASATASVVDPWNAVDGDLDTSAKIVRGVSALNAAFLTVVFKNQVMPTDEIQIVMKDPTNNGLTLDLLTGYQFQRYLGDTSVGDPIQGGNVLDLKLLTFTNDKVKLLVGSYDEPYDRIQIAYGSIVEAQLGDQVEIFDISVKPTVTDEDGNEEFEICQGDIFHLKEQDECTIYKVFDENDNELATTDGFDFEIPEDAEVGEHTYSVQAVRQGCEVGEKVEITVTVNPLPVLDGFEVTQNDDPAVVYAPGNSVVEVDPRDLIKIMPKMDEEESTGIDEVIWEMENPLNPGEWIAVPFGETTPGSGDVEWDIPAYGMIDINGQEVDLRNTNVQLRAILTSEFSCSITEELTLKISGKSFMISNPHIISKFKNN